MYYATFYQKAVWPAGTDKLIEACGDRAVIILDGRESTVTHNRIAARVARERGYMGYKLNRGHLSGRDTTSTSFVPVFKYTMHSWMGSASLGHANTEQEIGDKACAYADKSGLDVYTYDGEVGVAFPYVTWRKEYSSWVGTQHRTLEGARHWIELKQGVTT